MTWQENLFNNLLVAGIFIGLGLIIYCKVKQVTLLDVFKEIKEMFSTGEINE